MKPAVPEMTAASNPNVKSAQRNSECNEYTFILIHVCYLFGQEDSHIFYGNSFMKLA